MNSMIHHEAIREVSATGANRVAVSRMFHFLARTLNDRRGNKTRKLPFYQVFRGNSLEGSYIT